MKYRYIVLMGLLVALLVNSLPGTSSAEQLTNTSDLFFEDGNFPSGTGNDYEITPDGLTITNSAVTSIYTSPVIKAPIPFNAVVPQWIVDLPEGNSMEIMVRTANSSGVWSEWYDIDPQPDWSLPEDIDIVGDMVTVPAVDVTHDEIQFMVSFDRYEGDAVPVLQQLRLTFIDSTHGPTVEQMEAQQRALDEQSGIDNQLTMGYPRPSVISRSVWCTDPACNYSSGMSYSPVTHMVVHHTVSSNSSSDWAAVMRAIWNFHTYTRGWGDIGYNYLIDRMGKIYEGHNSKDYLNLDVIGTHASDANAGGFGVSLIGTFTTPDEYPVYDVPPQPMLDSLARLMAWKADQRNIDIYSASRMVNMSWGLPHVMGHRDVYGGTNTTCPGGNAHALLPWLRNEIASLIGFTSPHIYVDELSSAFTRSNPALYWWKAPKGCGNNGNAFYTYSVTNPADSTNWGEWRPNVPASGRYEIEVYAPYCDIGGPETYGASYQVNHADGTTRVVVNQSANIGLWTSLGQFNLLAGTGNVIRLTDLTTTDAHQAVWFDAIRIRQLPPTVTNGQPGAGAWLNGRTVGFSWTTTNPTAIQSTALQVATDASFTNKVVDKSWAGVVSNYTHTFSQDYANLYWRILLTTTFNAQVTSVPTRFGIDTGPPNSAVNRLYKYSSKVYELYWQGNDSLSGVGKYHVEYRVDGSSNWTRILSNSILTKTIFTAPDASKVYWFRSQAIDVASNSEPPHTGNGDMNTSQAVVITNPQAWNQLPTANAWRNDPVVSFNWTMTDTADVQTTTLRIATNSSFTSPVLTKKWPGVVDHYTYTFGTDYASLYWQVILTTSFGDQAFSMPTQFGIDTVPPISTMTRAYDHVMANKYELFWNGGDNLSGVNRYNIDVRANGSSNWTPLLSNTTLTTTFFVPPIPTETYWFRSQAVDTAGNVENPHAGMGDLSSLDAVVIFNPEAQNQAPTSQTWLNNASVNFNWSLTDVPNVQKSTLRVATDAAFTNVVLTKELFGTLTSHTAMLNQDSSTYYWQVTVDFTPPKAGLVNKVTSTPTVFGLDTAVPTSNITNIYQLRNAYFVMWDAQDTLSGVAAVNVDYRLDGQLTWDSWLVKNTDGRAVFTPPNPGKTYWFRTQAVDVAGNLEPALTFGNWNTNQAIPFPYAIMLPTVAR